MTALELRLRTIVDGHYAPSLVAIIRGHLDLARDACEKGQTNIGYQSFLAAERAAVAVMSPSERTARLVSMREEARQKLQGSWRGDALERLVGHDSEISVAALQEALFHLHSRSQDVYRKIDILRQQLTFLGMILAILVFAVVVLARVDYINVVNPNAYEMLPLAVLFGALGGSLSAFISATHTPPEAKIPDAQRTGVISMVRSLIGGAAAIPIYILLEGRLITGISEDVPAAALLGFCFLGGFSERWFISRIESLSGGAPHEPARDHILVGHDLTAEETRVTERDQRFRAGVGAVIARADGKVLVARRRNTEDSWQFPQGGIQQGETEENALFRELAEELGLHRRQLTVLAKHPELLSYELPAEYRSAKTGRGQSQRWFLLSLQSGIEVDLSNAEEFDGHRWVRLTEASNLAPDFRQPIYQRLADAFGEKLPGGGEQPTNG